ncbi:hypothetical protein DFH08DRAFT_984965 [Mycena albidolilacea]|uniref:Uncharacterized protein n=1 Tax=Mycena albidolilacea TaxID=1033008 RepID=A0AAD7EWX2_9AGAR|nr:hypothetical protein DFH08DRAFT_984965 [Mycena albidolilacea]
MRIGGVSFEPQASRGSLKHSTVRRLGGIRSLITEFLIRLPGRLVGLPDFVFLIIAEENPQTDISITNIISDDTTPRPVRSDEHVQDEFTPNHESRIPKQEESEPEPHSIYTPVEKRFIVALIAFGGLFSPLSSNIHPPIIPTLSQASCKPIELINITVTMYIVFEGLGLMFWGTLPHKPLIFYHPLLHLSLQRP